MIPGTMHHVVINQLFWGIYNSSKESKIKVDSDSLKLHKFKFSQIRVFDTSAQSKS